MAGDIGELQQVIEHAREEAERRQRGREVADGLRAAADPTPGSLDHGAA